MFVATRPFWLNESGHFGWDPKNLGSSCYVISIKDQIRSPKENRLSGEVFIMQKLFVTGVKVGSFAVALPPASGMTPGWAPYPFEQISLVLLIFLMIQSLSLSFGMLMVVEILISSLSLSPTSLKSSILAAPRPLVTHQEDGVLWQPSKNGVFDSGSTYSIALDLEIPKAPSLDWKWLWKIQIIPRVSSFLWLACLDKLPTCSLFTSCKIITDDSCPLCKSALESLLHSLRDCLVVLPIWLACMLSPSPTFFSTTSVLDWIKDWSSSLMPISINPQILWKDMFPIFAWSI